MTLSAYAHVMRELKGLPPRSREEQIEAARAGRGRLVDDRAATETQSRAGVRPLETAEIAPAGLEPATSAL